jgi:hypothetical protein
VQELPSSQFIGVYEHEPPAVQLSVVQELPSLQVPQFNVPVPQPLSQLPHDLPKEEQVAGEQIGAHKPKLQLYPEPQFPQLPPHPSLPQFFPEQAGVQTHCPTPLQV